MFPRFSPSTHVLLLPVCLLPEVQFRPYRTDDFITRLYYETPRFTVLNQTWVLKARVNDSERNPNLSCKRTLSFQLILKSKVHTHTASQPKPMPNHNPNHKSKLNLKTMF